MCFHRFRVLRRAVLGLALLVLIVAGAPARAEFFPLHEPTHDEVVFGCEPGPIEPFVHHDPPLPPLPVPDLDQPVVLASLVVDAGLAQPPMLGSGFNFEHTLWSCPTFRPTFRRRIIEPFRPALARVDTGQLPFAPEGVPGEDLTWQHYQGMMASEKYEPSWEMIRRLNRRDVKVMLGVWGAPGAFTHDGTRRGILLPEHIDHYVDYYTAVVDFLVRQKGLQVWSATIMNEPDGGDGTFIYADDFAEVARKLGPALDRYGVKLYGPDTASAEHALAYLPLLLEDEQIAPYLAAVATHQYYPSPYTERLVETVRASGLELPVIVTEYTSFHFGSLDRGQEAVDEVGFMLDIAATLVSHYDAGVDASLYWDVVDYYQAGHAATTRWGLLQGPAEAFAPRKRYHGMLQILPYLQPGSRVLSNLLLGDVEVAPLAVRFPGDGQRDVAIFLINQGGPILLDVSLHGLFDVKELEVYLTDQENDREHLGHVRFEHGLGQVFLPARSIVTLAAAGAPDEEFAARPTAGDALSSAP